MSPDGSPGTFLSSVLLWIFFSLYGDSFGDCKLKVQSQDSQKSDTQTEEKIRNRSTKKFQTPCRQKGRLEVFGRTICCVFSSVCTPIDLGTVIFQGQYLQQSDTQNEEKQQQNVQQKSSRHPVARWVAWKFWVERFVCGFSSFCASSRVWIVNLWFKAHTHTH